MPISIGGGNGNVWYDPATGILYYGSTPISYETVTYAQFMDSGFDVATERTVYVTDRHSTRDGTSEPGSFWRIIPSATSAYKRQLISGPIYCANEAAAPTASDHPGLQIFDAGLGPSGCYRYSDGTGYLVRPGSIIQRTTAKSTALVCPASTFIGAYTIISHSSGARTQIQGAGAHGLTAAIAEGGPCVYISAGTDWTVGFHEIYDVDVAADTIVLNTTYTPSFGQPTIVLANSGTDVTLQTITLPRLSSNSRVSVRASLSFPSSATNKTFKVKLGGTTLYQPTLNGVGVSNYGEWTFYNRTVSSQKAAAGYLAPTGLGSSSVAGNTAAIDTSTGTAQITLSYSPAAANEVCAIEVSETEIR